jgi:hypothetical protein
MKTNLTKNEEMVLKAIVENARNVGDESVEFIMSDVAEATGKPQKVIQGICSSLKKKGYVQCYNSEAYFDGEIRPIAEEWYKESFETKDDFDKPAVDKRIVRLNEIIETKGEKREAKTAARYILENWDNAEINGGLKSFMNDDEMKANHKELHQIAKSRYWQLVELAAKEIEEKILTKEILLNDDEKKLLETFVFNIHKMPSKIKEEAIWAGVNESNYDIALTNLKRHGFVNNKGVTHAGRNAYDCLIRNNDSEITSKASESKKEGKVTSTTKKTSRAERKVGDHHPTQPWVWTEYKPGKFDWRSDKKKIKKETKKAKQPKQITTEEFINGKINKHNLSATQAEYLKLLRKGYWIWNNGGHYFFKNEEGKMKQCNIDSLKSLFKKFNIEEIPSCLIR